MCSSKPNQKVPKRVQRVLNQLNQESRISNLHQALLGKRVPLNEKTMSCDTSVEEIAYKTREMEKPEIILHVSYSDVHFTESKEPIPFKLAKEDELSMREKDHERNLILY